MKRYLLSTPALGLLASCASAADKASPPVSGIDLQHIAPGLRAQDDFFPYLNGKRLKTTEIPPDRASWGSAARQRDRMYLAPQDRVIICQAATQ